MYAFTVLVLLHSFFLFLMGGRGGGGILSFCHVDIDVCLYSTCAFLTVKWILMLIIYSAASLYFF